MREELRIAVVFRADLDIPRGKSEVQCGHVIAMLLYEQHDACDDYMAGSQMKLSMEVPDTAALEKIARRAALRHIPCVKVVDAGRTVFDGPTFTCIAIGPMDKTDCNALTREARMRT